MTLSWTCTYYNDTNTTLVFGDSAITNEMCIVAGYFYPYSTTSDFLLCF